MTTVIPVHTHIKRRKTETEGNNMSSRPARKSCKILSMIKKILLSFLLKKKHNQIKYRQRLDCSRLPIKHESIPSLVIS